MKCCIMLIGIVLLSGCARQNIPVYPKTGVNESLQLIADRNAAVQTVEGQATITLTDPAGQSVRLDGAFVMKPPGQMRVRAWKFGQAVFDLTLNSDGIYQYVAREEARQSMPITRQVLDHWLRMLFGTGASAEAIVKENSSEIKITNVLSNGLHETRLFDRPTLTQRRVELIDSAGHKPFVIELDKYETAGNSVWPMRVRAVSEQGVIEIQFSSVDLNLPLAESAFNPPSRAERVQ